MIYDIYIYIPRSSYLSLFLPLPRWLVISAAKSAETTRNAAGIGHGQQLCSHLVFKIFWGPGFQSANASEVLSFVHSIPFAKTLNCDLCFHFICFQHIPLHVSCWYSSALSWDLPYEIFAHTVIEDGRIEFVFSPLIQRVLTFFSVVHPSVQLWHLSKEAVVFLWGSDERGRRKHFQIFALPVSSEKHMREQARFHDHGSLAQTTSHLWHQQQSSVGVVGFSETSLPVAAAKTHKKKATSGSRSCQTPCIPPMEKHSVQRAYFELVKFLIPATCRPFAMQYNLRFEKARFKQVGIWLSESSKKPGSVAKGGKPFKLHPIEPLREEDPKSYPVRTIKLEGISIIFSAKNTEHKHPKQLPISICQEQPM